MKLLTAGDLVCMTMLHGLAMLLVSDIFVTVVTTWAILDVAFTLARMRTHVRIAIGASLSPLGNCVGSGGWLCYLWRGRVTRALGPVGLSDDGEACTIMAGDSGEVVSAD